MVQPEDGIWQDTQARPFVPKLLKNEFDKSIEPEVETVDNCPLGSGVFKGVGILRWIACPNSEELKITAIAPHKTQGRLIW